MTTTFQSRITSALNNPALQSALDKSAQRRIAGRTAAFESLPEAEAVRDRARAIRLETLAHLGQYLEEFVSRLEERGAQVHFAANAEEACAIVIELAQERGVTAIAKSKSMVSEEIELNHALHAAGITPVETDLGEYIIQLRGETPSHIITPAIHLRREDVAKTFQDHLGMAPTTDVSVMTALARQTLRQTFLTAGLGLSGVNFGVAETGSVCLVTNEGNGRMVTTVPPVHVALMGIERLVPSLEDLDVMLKVLARSATGQKLTVYTSILSGSRRSNEPDGPDELHVILLDNGRSRIRESELAESLLCIRCGACLNVCPVYREIGGHAYAAVYSGPIGSILTPAFGGAHDFGYLAHASSLCGACLDVCPVRIDIPSMLLTVRGQHVEEARQPAWLSVGMKFYSWVMRSPRRYRFAQTLAGLGTRLLARNGRLRRLPGPLSAWTMNRDFPAFPRGSFRERLARRQRNGATALTSLDWPDGQSACPGLRQGMSRGQAADSALPTRPAGTGATTRDRSHNHPARAGRSAIPEPSSLAGLLSRLRATPPHLPPVPFLPSLPSIPSPSDGLPGLMSRFSDELTALGGTFATVTPEKLPQAILDILDEKKARRMIAWLPENLPAPGLFDWLRRAGVTIYGPMVSTSGAERESSLAERATAEAGLTSCEAVIAETGSLLMRAGPGRGRLASLIAPVHIALVTPKQFFPTFAAFVAHHRRNGTHEALCRDSSALTLITGPSRTADIEMTLTIGVHGPAEVRVLCVAS